MEKYRGVRRGKRKIHRRGGGGGYREGKREGSKTRERGLGARLGFSL